MNSDNDVSDQQTPSPSPKKRKATSSRHATASSDPSSKRKSRIDGHKSRDNDRHSKSKEIPKKAMRLGDIPLPPAHGSSSYASTPRGRTDKGTAGDSADCQIVEDTAPSAPRYAPDVAYTAAIQALGREIHGSSASVHVSASQIAKFTDASEALAGRFNRMTASNDRLTKTISEFNHAMTIWAQDHKLADVNVRSILEELVGVSKERNTDAVTKADLEPIKEMLKELPPLIRSVENLKGFVQGLAAARQATAQNDGAHSSDSSVKRIAKQQGPRTPQCQLCDATSHSALDCTAFVTHENRKTQAQFLGLCTRCLKKYRSRNGEPHIKCSAKDIVCSECAKTAVQPPMSNHSPVFCFLVKRDGTASGAPTACSQHTGQSTGEAPPAFFNKK